MTIANASFSFSNGFEQVGDTLGSPTQVFAVSSGGENIFVGGQYYSQTYERDMPIMWK